jgi:hypothetical protein
VTPSSELRLTAECCRRTFADGASDPADLAAQVDWNRFLVIARFHRVQGLVCSGLRLVEVDIPPQIDGALSFDAEAIAMANLAIAVESRALRSAFEAADVNLLFLKGLSVGALAYRSPMLKMGWDIDLLIEEQQLGPAAQVLSECGYRPVLPARNTQLVDWHRRHKESVWTRGDLHVELHTRLSDNPALIRGLGVYSPSQEVEVAPDVQLPTLAPQELIAYLCVHGASSAWFRLKWITDFAALLHRYGDIERVYQRSLELGAGRAAAQAFLLADALYGSLGGTNLKARLESDRAARWLASAALTQIMRGSEPTEVRFGTARIHLTQLLLLPGLAFPLGEMGRQANAAFASLRNR